MQQIQDKISITGAQNNFAQLGKILDWSALAEVTLLNWHELLSNISSTQIIFELSIDEFCIFSQGFYRYDSKKYCDWFNQNYDSIIGYLKLNLDCLSLELFDDELYFEFLVDLNSDDPSGYEETNSRLRRFRSAIPFCKQYQSHGIWLSIKTPLFNDTDKNVNKDLLPYSSDGTKVNTWHEVAYSNFIPDSYYDFQKAWNLIRTDAIEFVKYLSKFFRSLLTHGSDPKIKNHTSNIEVFITLDKALDNFPSSYDDSSEIISSLLPCSLQTILKKDSYTNKLYQSFHTFFYKMRDSLLNPESINNTKDIILNSFLFANYYLPKLHHEFDTLFESCPDYFNIKSLNSIEKSAYSTLEDLLQACFSFKIFLINEIEKELQKSREYQVQILTNKTTEVSNFLKDIGIDTVLSSDVYNLYDEKHDYINRYFSLAFSVHNPLNYLEVLRSVLEAILKISNIADFFCLIPVYKEKLFLPPRNGYHISSLSLLNILGSGEDLNLLELVSITHSLTIQELPESTFSYLPELEYEEYLPLTLKGEAVALYTLVISLVKYARAIHRLMATRNDYEVKLYEQHLSKIYAFNRNILNKIHELKDKFASYSNQQIIDMNLLSFQQFIYKASENLETPSIDNILSIDISSDSIDLS
ncbi:hypothetical protein [Acaryochloris marina]|uniref:Uncharacterized protein n=1 Tax=Acaryochloris marina (strain MBIC 11017) TaxID=329726 RepID=A8ZNI6_ACAM1|nr:hypothetical protein [Acaryochloris marina]ABW32572.1 hypothetical protein AM1_D0077 [Acaryochloris marina MBIC11017]